LGFKVDNRWLKKAAWEPTNIVENHPRRYISYKTHGEKWDQNAEIMHVYYIDHEYWESMSAETMTFTTRETVECDEGSLSGRFHIRGDENPPWNAT